MGIASGARVPVAAMEMSGPSMTWVTWGDEGERQQLPEAGAYIDFAWALAPGPWRKNEPPAAWRGCQYVPGQATRRAAGLPDTAAGPGRRDIRSSDAAGDRQAAEDPRTARNVAWDHETGA